MEIKAQIEAIIDKRRSLEMNDDYGIGNCRKAANDLLIKNLESTIKCLDELDSNYFYWICEIFDDLSEYFQSNELIACMKRNAKRTGVDCNIEIEYACKVLK